MAKNEVRYLNYLFSDDDETLRSGNTFDVISLQSDELQADTIELEIKCADKKISDFLRNTPLFYYHEGLKRGTYYVQSIERIGPQWYTIQAESAMGLLAQMPHYGGIYTGQTVETVIKDICKSIPVVIKTDFSQTKLYGWLPFVKPPSSTARDNLSQVLFAIGATVKTDMNGVLHIEGLWDGVSGQIGESCMFIDGSVTYSAKVSRIDLTEHQYVPGTEVKSLFEGTTIQGDIITFSEPMHSLYATGFSILEHGANYAKLSSGTGVLTGKIYVHNTRIISETVVRDAAENVKSIEDATLVSLVNSKITASRLAAYYRCTEEITSPVITSGEKPGDLIMMYHPYDGEMVKACIRSQDTAMSSFLKATTKALVGFTPTQNVGGHLESVREVLTKSGSITVPDGVTSIRAVLIGGGSGGNAGNDGEPGGIGTRFTYSNPSFGIKTYWRTLGPGGAGGLGGAGGQGGKVLEVDINVTPGQVIPYTIGTGGTAEADGGATTFAGHSSDSGSVPVNGYTDTITGEVFASHGETGYPGGSGNGWAGGEANRNNALSIKTGEMVGGYGPGADDKSEREDIDLDGNLRAIYYYILSGGGARNANGSTAGGGVGIKGGKGADATFVPPAPAIIGNGGRGGSGGGGGGGSGAFQSRISLSGDTPGGDGGAGGPGGPGASGGIILYYNRYVETPRGPLLDKNRMGLLDRYGRRLIV